MSEGFIHRAEVVPEQVGAAVAELVAAAVDAVLEAARVKSQGGQLAEALPAGGEAVVTVTIRGQPVRITPTAVVLRRDGHEPLVLFRGGGEALQ